MELIGKKLTFAVMGGLIVEVRFTRRWVLAGHLSTTGLPVSIRGGSLNVVFQSHKELKCYWFDYVHQIDVVMKKSNRQSSIVVLF